MIIYSAFDAAHVNALDEVAQTERIQDDDRQDRHHGDRHLGRRRRQDDLVKDGREFRVLQKRPL